MSVIEISLPDDRWFSGEWEIRPKDKQMCTVLMKDDLFPVICQWSNKIDCEDGISRGYFTDVSLAKMYMEIGEPFEDRHIYMEFVERWHPLGLPEDVNERVLAEIEKWLEEDE